MRKIFRAISSRSRKARSKQRPLRANRVLLLAPIGVTLVVLALFARDVEVLASSLRDPLAMWGDRSPGNRDAGALYDIKPERILAAARSIHPSKIVPSERVLPVTRERPVPGLGDIVPGDFFLEPVAFDPGLVPIASPANGGGSSPYLAPMSFSPLGGGAGVGGGGPSDTPSTVPTDTPIGLPTDEPSTPTDVPSTPIDVPSTPIDVPSDIDDTGPTDIPPAVPEPTTWAMNILGLFLVGGAMRRHNRKGAGIALAAGA